MEIKMKRNDIKIGFSGFAIAFVGLMLGFLGSEIQVRWISVASFFITSLGIVGGMIGVAYGWVIALRVGNKKP
jgi:hypothetical protein